MSEPLAGSVDSSPRTRRYFRSASRLCAHRRLFPAHAGVFPVAFGETTKIPSLPRARGGISEAWAFDQVSGHSSPRTRGYFHIGEGATLWDLLFPAHAGVFPRLASRQASSPPLPRARGGISGLDELRRATGASSPRTRGYFQTHSGVVDFFATLPRARGGISVDRLNVSRMRGSSPRTRGYFQYASRVHPYARLFPARAGVFPAFGDIDEPIERSSPRTRGYFRAVKDP